MPIASHTGLPGSRDNVGPMSEIYYNTVPYIYMVNWPMFNGDAHLTSNNFLLQLRSSISHPSPRQIIHQDGVYIWCTEIFAGSNSNVIALNTETTGDITSLLSTVYDIPTSAPTNRL